MCERTKVQTALLTVLFLDEGFMSYLGPQEFRDRLFNPLGHARAYVCLLMFQMVINISRATTFIRRLKIETSLWISGKEERSEWL